MKHFFASYNSADWNVPHHRNPNFSGRKSLLAALRAALTAGRPAALTQAISGVGKTQLAVEYAYRHAAGYGLVWWVRAREPATLAADYAGLAGPLDLPQRDEPEQRVVVEAVRHWLGQNTGWLLVFDDARDPAEVRDYLPPGASGHVLVTSRYPAWRGVASPLVVPVLERAESVEFLQKRTGQAGEGVASALAGELGDLPLALEQAGAYVEVTGTTLADYLELFRARRTELGGKEHLPPDYPDTVATTWSLAMERVRGESPAGADLLNLCAYLGSDDIPHTLLSEGEEHIPEPLSATVTDPLAMNKALVALRQYSLLEIAGDALSVHRLVQAVVRDRLAEEARQRLDGAHHRTWAEVAVRLVDGTFPLESDDVQTWPRCARLLPHALAAAGHAEVLGVASEVTGCLLNQVAGYLYGRAELAEAKATLERALVIDEAAFGPDHPNVAMTVDNLGLVLRDLGDLDGARAAFERALAIFEEVLGADHPNVTTLVNNLGGVLRDLGDLDGARAAFERVLAIDEAAFGSNHPNVAIRANNLGRVLRDLGDLDGARVALERALAIHDQKLGENQLNIATTLNDLGNLLRRQGNHAKARIYLERALAVYEQVFDKQHPWVAITANNLGSVLQELGDLAGARAAFERALAIFEATLPPGHRYIERARRHLESVVHD